MNAKRLARLIGGGAVALVAASVAWGFVFIKDNGGYVNTWFPGTIPMQVKLATSPALSDGTSQSASVMQAMIDWNAQLGVVQFSGQQLGPGAYSNGNDINEIVMDSTVDEEAFGENTLAVTVSWRSGNERTESDIVFNTKWTWDSFRGPLPVSPEDIRRVAIHELGHVLGLTHPNQNGQSVTAIMNSTASSVDALQSDDITGGQTLYGSPGFVPANNNFANATVISLSNGSTTVTGTNVAATAEADEPAMDPDDPGRRTVWWKWTAPANGSINITTLGSYFDTLLGIYTGSAVSALSQIALNDDQQSGVIRTSTVSFNVTSGTTYHIAVDGWGGYFGSINLNLSFSATVSPPSIFVQPSSRTVSEGPAFPGGPLNNVQFSVLPYGGSGIPNPSIQWQRLSAGAANWVTISEGVGYSNVTGLVLTVSPVTFSMNGDQFRAVLTNGVGSTTSNPATLTVPAPVPPTFVNLQLSNLAVLAGTNLTLLHAGYDGGGIISLQWYRNGSALPGATGASLALLNVQVADAGSYTLRVSNVSGSVTSAPCVLSVQAGVSVVRAAASISSFSAFINSLGELWMMGTNSFNNMGGVSTGETRNPVRIAESVVAVALGQRHTLFLKADGTLWGMGDNATGQLGLGVTSTVTAPTQIALNVSKVFSGSNHSLFIKTDGTLWGMGSNLRGQLGNGTQTDQKTPIQIATNVVKAAGGSDHTLFLKTDGTLWGAGHNGFYQLGDMNTGGFLSPVQIATGVASIAAGNSHSLFIRTDGSLWGMGWAQIGQLGDGAPLWATRLTLNAIATNVAEVTAHDESSFFLKTNGSVWAMGSNGGYALGDGTTITRTTPVQIASGVQTLSNGRFYIDTAGSLWAWGGNAAGQLGDGTTTGRPNHMRIVQGVGSSASTFTSQPLNVSAALGSSANFTVLFTGYPILACQWQRRSAGSGTWINLSNDGVYSGVASTTLSISGVTLAMSGEQFRCVVTNAMGSSTSNAAMLTVILVNGINYGSTTFPANATAGATVTFNHTLTNSGTKPWGANHYLVLQNPAGANIGFASLSGTAAGQSKTVSFTFTTPATAGAYTYHLQGLENGVEWFGPERALTFTVPVNALSYGTTTFPARANTRGTVSFTYQVTNTGAQAWGANHYLVLKDATGTSLAFASVSGTASGASRTVTFTFVAPASPGSYTYRVEGLENGVAWFGAPRELTLEVRSGSGTDFDNDGKPDLIWQNLVTGQRALWLMDGITPVSSAPLITIPTEWDLVGAADFNLDGKPDLIWQNTVTGQRALWLMDGTTPVSSVPLINIPIEWDLVGTADFNQDGKPDLIWQNTVTGQRALWLMDGTTPVSSANLVTIPTQWDLVGAADFNADGHPDLLWQNTVSGQRAIWTMNGTTPVSSVPLLAISTEWSLVM